MRGVGRICTCKTASRHLMECRKEHEQLVVMMVPTRRLDGVVTMVKEASEAEKWTDVLNISGIRRLGFLPKTRTMNVPRRWKIRLLRGYVIGFGM